MGKRIAITEFVIQSHLIHNNKYDYSNTIFNGIAKKLKIVCPAHGEFEQSAYSHINGIGCWNCGVEKRANSTKHSTKQFIERASIIHNFKYSYNECDYINARTKVNIWCSIHQYNFQQMPGNHLAGRGCPKCSLEMNKNKNLKTEEKFLEEAIITHGDKYNYSLIKYINCYTTIQIICNECKLIFWQSPSGHLSGRGCKNCSTKLHALKRLKTTEVFIIDANKIHNNKYDYSQSIYLGARINLIINCNVHGDFTQTPTSHLSGSGCMQCSLQNKKLILSEWIIDCNSIHNNKYNYSNIENITSIVKCSIICPFHGAFLQNPSYHLMGQGCPRCIHTTSKCEKEWILSLNNQNIETGIVIGSGKGRIKPDGFDPSTNTIYEFYGSYYHGDPTKYTADEYNQTCKTTFGELYQKTMSREKLIKDAGYNLITIWESEWNKIKKLSTAKS